ncbi:MAG: hypothetical protein DDG59_14535 [Anaerolineae bacterium]|jgi:hypothetical protein|nr:MAG: hypothetical protein DDG59_14535 [Anaerolineae bacterium]
MNAKSFLKEQFIKLEQRLKAVIEGSTAQIVSSKLDSQEIAAQLRRILQENHQTLQDGHLLAPNYFLLAASPLYAEKLRKQQPLLKELEEELEHLATKAGLTFASPPVIQIVEDEDIPYPQVSISGYFSQDMTETHGINEKEAQDHPEIPQNAFLIVNGVNIFPLDKPVINIGRHPDNHLVLDDARVSRQHAQLRAVRGQYRLFDLGSAGGTLVNNQPIRQAILSPGDVISLAGIPLVYGEDRQAPGKTQKLSLNTQ